jgi:hypothetical protein
MDVIQLGRLNDRIGANRFAFPSIAVTAENDVLIGFSRFGSAIYASAAYVYRNHSDPLNTLRTTFTYKAGANSYFKIYGGPTNRWGDFSATCIDYWDNTFWTLQEFATATANTWGTWWANVGVPAATIASTKLSVTNASKVFIITPNPARDVATLRWQSTATGNALLSVVNARGSSIYKQKIQVIKGYNEHGIVLRGLSSGTYMVILTANNITERTKLVIEK